MNSTCFFSLVFGPTAAGSANQAIGTILFFVLLILCFLILWWLESRRKRVVKTETSSQLVREESQAAAVSEPVKAVPVTLPDDLVILEGIGPKIKQILNAHGITTFAQLADANVDDLKKILAEANLRIADPTTWPKQARLAASGDMEGLKKLQDSLKGGRQVS